MISHCSVKKHHDAAEKEEAPWVNDLELRILTQQSNVSHTYPQNKRRRQFLYSSLVSKVRGELKALGLTLGI